MKDQESMEKILKENEIDVVISAVGGANILDQLTLVRAMKTVGTIKVKEEFFLFLFFPSKKIKIKVWNTFTTRAIIQSLWAMSRSVPYYFSITRSC